MKNLYRFIGGVIAAGLLVAATGCAATLSTRVGGDGGYRVDGQRRAYARGYNVGLEQGLGDVRASRRFDYEQHKEFRDGDKGYNRRDGDRGAYRDAYRTGFTTGYSESYRANTRGGDRDEDRDRSRRR